MGTKRAYGRARKVRVFVFSLHGKSNISSDTKDTEIGVEGQKRVLRMWDEWVHPIRTAHLFHYLDVSVGQ